jgi:hypothetical protein
MRLMPAIVPGSAGYSTLGPSALNVARRSSNDPTGGGSAPKRYTRWSWSNATPFVSASA